MAEDKKKKTTTTKKKGSSGVKKKTTSKATTSKKSTTAKTKNNTATKSVSTKKKSSNSGTKKKTTTKKSTSTKTNTSKKTTTKKSTSTKTNTRKTTTRKKSTPNKVEVKKPIKEDIDEKVLNTTENDFRDVLNIDEDKVQNTIEDINKLEVEENTDLMNVLDIDEDKVQNTIEDINKLEVEEKPDLMNVLDIDEDRVENTVEEIVKPKKIVEKVSIKRVRTRKFIKTRKLKDWVYKVILLLLGLLLVFLLFKLLGFGSLNSRLNSKYVHINNDKYNINFDKLKKLNEDTVGYVRLNGTNIRHIVVKGTDNEYYKNHNFLDKESKTGWVYMDSKNKLNGTDKNIVIYGKNSKDMFGSLDKALTKRWIKHKKDNYLTYVSNDTENKYKVFSVYKVSDANIEAYFDTYSDYSNYLGYISEKSDYDYKVRVGTYDNIITLVSYDDNGLVVLHAKLIKNK